MSRFANLFGHRMRRFHLAALARWCSPGRVLRSREHVALRSFMVTTGKSRTHTYDRSCSENFHLNLISCGGGTRTPMPCGALAPQASASANFAHLSHGVNPLSISKEGALRERRLGEPPLHQGNKRADWWGSQKFWLSVNLVSALSWAQAVFRVCAPVLQSRRMQRRDGHCGFKNGRLTCFVDLGDDLFMGMDSI